VNLQGRTIWLIGASEGIGEDLARLLANKGARLALSARNAEKLRGLADELGSQHVALPLDVCVAGEVERGWQGILQNFGTLDFVIYNAGAYKPVTAQSFDLATVETMLDINLRGALRVLSFVLPHFLARNAGRIALVGSVAGYRGLPNAIGYGLSKAALIHLAENLRIDLARTAIEVQIINPGFVATRLTAQNKFKMPHIITSLRAAHYIVRGIERDDYEIDFPRAFSWQLKLLRLLPNALYFRIMRLLPAA